VLYVHVLDVCSIIVSLLKVSSKHPQCVNKFSEMCVYVQSISDRLQILHTCDFEHDRVMFKCSV